MQPHHVNYIRKQLHLLIGAFYFAGDYRVLEASRDSVIENIRSQFYGLMPEQHALLDEAALVRDKDELKIYLQKLAPYVIPFPPITAAEIDMFWASIK